MILVWLLVMMNPHVTQVLKVIVVIQRKTMIVMVIVSLKQAQIVQENVVDQRL